MECGDSLHLSPCIHSSVHALLSGYVSPAPSHSCTKKVVVESQISPLKCEAVRLELTGVKKT